MLKRVTAFVSAVLMTLCLSSCSMTEKSEKQVKHCTDVPPKMVFLGDSIAAGYGLEGYTDTDNYNCRSYSNILKEKYEAELDGKCGHVMVNKAVSGYTSDELIDQLKSGELDDALKDSDAVVVSIGGNDLLGIMLNVMAKMGIKDATSFDSGDFDFIGAASSLLSLGGDIDKALAKFDENIKVITQELGKRTNGKIYIQTLYDPLEYFSNYKIVTDFSNEKIGRLNSIISDNSSEGYTVINVAGAFKGKAGELTNISDWDIHPNAAGHVVISKEVDAAFRATGFSYTTTEEGDLKLTKEAELMIGIGIFGSIAVLCIIVMLCRKVGKKKD